MPQCALAQAASPLGLLPIMTGRGVLSSQLWHDTK